LWHVEREAENWDLAACMSGIGSRAVNGKKITWPW
jgi:hypothetical protein